MAPAPPQWLSGSRAKLPRLCQWQVREVVHETLPGRDCKLRRVLRNGLCPCQRLAGQQGVLAARAARLLQLKGLQAELSCVPCNLAVE